MSYVGVKTVSSFKHQGRTFLYPNANPLQPVYPLALPGRPCVFARLTRNARPTHFLWRGFTVHCGAPHGRGPIHVEARCKQKHALNSHPLDWFMVGRNRSRPRRRVGVFARTERTPWCAAPDH